MYNDDDVFYEDDLRDNISDRAAARAAGRAEVRAARKAAALEAERARVTAVHARLQAERRAKWAERGPLTNDEVAQLEDLLRRRLASPSIVRRLATDGAMTPAQAAYLAGIAGGARDNGDAPTRPELHAALMRVLTQSEGVAWMDEDRRRTQRRLMDALIDLGAEVPGLANMPLGDLVTALAAASQV